MDKKNEYPKLDEVRVSSKSSWDFQNQNPVSDCENDQLLCRGATANNIAISIPKGMKNSHDDEFFSFYIPFGRQHSKKTPLYYLKKQALTLQSYSPYGSLEPAIVFLEVFSPHVILELFFGWLHPILQHLLISAYLTGKLK